MRRVAVVFGVVPVFLGAGGEQDAREKDDDDNRHDDKRGSNVHSADSLRLRVPKAKGLRCFRLRTNPESTAWGAKQAAEKACFRVQSAKSIPPGLKPALIFGFMRGLKPSPPSGFGFSAPALYFEVDEY